MPEGDPIVAGLLGFEGRGPCTDAERRAAAWLHDRLRDAGHEAWVETHWVRPQWPAALALACALGVAAAPLSTVAPAAGAVLAAVAALALAVEATGRQGPLRLLLPRRATQNVLVPAPDGDRITALICARYDAPRRGLVFRDGLRRLAARLPGRPVGWLAAAAAVVGAGAALRQAGAGGAGVGLLQLVPAATLVLGLAAALDAALSDHAPGAGDNASGVAAAVALHAALGRHRLARLSCGLLLHGAGEGSPLGLRAQLRVDRPDPERTVLVELGPCGAGEPSWHAAHEQLVEACAPVAPRARRRPGHGPSRALPSLWLGALERRIAPRARQPEDTVADPAVLAATVAAAEAALLRLDRALESAPPVTAAAPAAR